MLSETISALTVLRRYQHPWSQMYLVVGRFDMFREQFITNVICHGRLVTGTLVRAIHEYATNESTTNCQRHNTQLDKPLEELINEYHRVVVNRVIVSLSLYGDDEKLIDTRLTLGEQYRPNPELFRLNQNKFKALISQINSTNKQLSENNRLMLDSMVRVSPDTFSQLYDSLDRLFNLHDEFWHRIVNSVRDAKKVLRSVQVNINENGSIVTTIIANNQLTLPAQYLRACCNTILQEQ